MSPVDGTFYRVASARNGRFYSRTRLRSFIMRNCLLRALRPDALERGALVDSFLDCDRWMTRHTGETPASIARFLVDDVFEGRNPDGGP